MSRKIPIYLKEVPDNLTINLQELEKFESFNALQRHFKDDQTCRDFLEQQRWNGKPECPFCGAQAPYRTNRGFKCSNPKCHKKFSVTVGTIYENTNLPLIMWFSAIYLATQNLSSAAIARKVGVSQKTAWFMLNKMRTKAALKNKLNPSLIMESTTDRDNSFNELRRLYLTRQISYEQLARGMAGTNDSLMLTSDSSGMFACTTIKLVYYTTNNHNRSTDMRNWIPAGYWQKTPRAAVIHCLNKLHKEKNNLLFDDEPAPEAE